VLSYFCAKDKKSQRSLTIFHFNNFSRWFISCQQGSRYIRDFLNVIPLPVQFVIINERLKGDLWSYSFLTNLLYNNHLLARIPFLWFPDQQILQPTLPIPTSAVFLTPSPLFLLQSICWHFNVKISLVHLCSLLAMLRSANANKIPNPLKAKLA
jgi:hypothetical protein